MSWCAWIRDYEDFRILKTAVNRRTLGAAFIEHRATSCDSKHRLYAIKRVYQYLSVYLDLAIHVVCKYLVCNCCYEVWFKRWSSDKWPIKSAVIKLNYFQGNSWQKTLTTTVQIMYGIVSTWYQYFVAWAVIMCSPDAWYRILISNNSKQHSIIRALSLVKNVNIVLRLEEFGIKLTIRGIL